MKRILVVGALLLTAVFMVTGCNSENKTNNDPKPNNQVKGNKTAEVVQSITGGIPYNWEYKIADTSIVKFKEEKEQSSENDMTGGSEKISYTFESLKEGQTTITFELKSAIDDTVEETKKYSVVVDKDLNISIKETK